MWRTQNTEYADRVVKFPLMAGSGKVFDSKSGRRSTEEVRTARTQVHYASAKSKYNQETYKDMPKAQGHLPTHWEPFALGIDGISGAPIQSFKSAQPCQVWHTTTTMDAPACFIQGHVLDLAFGVNPIIGQTMNVPLTANQQLIFANIAGPPLPSYAGAANVTGPMWFVQAMGDPKFPVPFELDCVNSTSGFMANLNAYPAG
ncbi:hypothetical protein B0H10DRAFT_1940766 [Mycena sp. CBHHK59/15]|nr:hypothetical protein B0H10DRAFT_1940766 [Mycena sp. CBHHK59/15]